MLTTIILILGLMVGTAVIAYWSDNLGKKLGKKRVTLFGLRPKQTATLITITSSMPIMLFTLAATLAVYKPLRDALTKFEATRRENSLLLLQNEVTQKSLERARTEEKVATQSAQAATRKAEAASRGASEAERQAKAARSKLAAAQGKLDQANKLAEEAQKREREALEGARNAKNGERQARAGELQARGGEQRAREQEQQAVSQARRAQENSRRAQQNLKAAQQNFSRAKQRLDSANATLAVAQAQVTSKQEEVTRLTQDVARLIRQRGNLDRTTVAQGKQILGQAKEIEERNSQIAQLAAQVEQSRAAARLAEEELAATRNRVTEVLSKPTLVPAGETLAEKVFPPRQSQERVQRQLQDLVEQARLQARSLSKGAGPLNVDIEFPTLHLSLPDGTTEDIGRGRQFSILTGQLLSADVPSSVRVIAARSHTTSERSIEVRLRVVEVRRAFRSGEVLASANIDGSGTAARIFKQLLDLANDGQRTAEDRGVQPPLARDVPFYAPLTNERIFEALRSIQALRGPASVRVVAVGDLTTASPLSVRFDVAPAIRQSA